MIEFESVSRYFGTKRALDDVSFAVPDGSITGLVGPSGTGKTTAIRILDGDSQVHGGRMLEDAFFGLTDNGGLGEREVS